MTIHSDYRTMQQDLRARSRQVLAHSAEDRAKTGNILRFSDRSMMVMPDGSLRRIADPIAPQAAGLVNGPLVVHPSGCPGSWFSINNSASSDRAEIRLYGEIGTGWSGSQGVTVQQFADELRNIPLDREIDCRLHSPGGSVFDGLLIYNLLRGRRDKVTAHIDGLAASIASVIAMAAGTICMPKTARMMVHDAQGFVVGDSAAMKDMATLLDRESDNIAAIYAERTGLTQKRCRAMMKDTTWLNGPEALAAHFCDKCTDGSAQNALDFDLSCFARLPLDLNPSPDAARGGSLNQNPITPISPMLPITPTPAPAAVTPTPTPAPTNTAAPAISGAAVPAVTSPATVPVAAPAAPAAPTNLITLEQFAAIQNQLAHERAIRIGNQIDALIGEGRPFINRATALPRAIADENFLTELRAMPVVPVGADPVRPVVTNCGNTLLDGYRAMKPGAARNAHRIANHADLIQVSREFNPRNNNTVSASLLPDYLVDAVLVATNNKLAMLDLFSSNFSTDRLAPKRKIAIRKGSTAGTVQTNPTNFETGDTTLDIVEVTVAQVSRSFQITNDEMNQGHRLAHLAEVNAQVFVNGISDIVTALFLAATFGAGTAVGAAANFDGDDLKPIRALAKNFAKKNLIMDGGYISYLLPKQRIDFAIGEQGAFGFDAIVEQNRWTNAVANCVGIVASPLGLAVGSGLPTELPAGEFLSLGQAATQNGLTAQTASWFSRGGRVHWASFDVMFGAAAGVAAELKLLISQ